MRQREERRRLRVPEGVLVVHMDSNHVALYADTLTLLWEAVKAVIAQRRMWYCDGRHCEVRTDAGAQVGTIVGC